MYVILFIIIKWGRGWSCRGPKKWIGDDEYNEMKSELTRYSGKLIAGEELKGFFSKKLSFREPKNKGKLC